MGAKETVVKLEDIKPPDPYHSLNIYPCPWGDSGSKIRNTQTNQVEASGVI